MKGDPGCHLCKGSGRYFIDGESEACVEGRDSRNAALRAAMASIKVEEEHRRIVRELLARWWAERVALDNEIGRLRAIVQHQARVLDKADMVA